MPDRNRPLYDYAPKELSDEQLNALYGALIAKLSLTCDELIRRHEEQAALSETVLQTDKLNALSDAEKQQHKDDAKESRASAGRVRMLRTALQLQLLQIKSEAEK